MQKSIEYWDIVGNPYSAVNRLFVKIFSCNEVHPGVEYFGESGTILLSTGCFSIIKRFGNVNTVHRFRLDHRFGNKN